MVIGRPYGVLMPASTDTAPTSAATYRSARCSEAKHTKCLGLLCECTCHTPVADIVPVYPIAQIVEARDALDGLLYRYATVLALNGKQEAAREVEEARLVAKQAVADALHGGER